MNKSQYDNLEKLCVSLESGQYAQGNGCLRNSKNEFCCLGVGLDVVDKDGWGNLVSTRYTHKLGSDHNHYEDFINHETDTYYMADEGLNLFGLTKEDQAELSHKNDTGYSFSEIAEYIRVNIMARYKEGPV